MNVEIVLTSALYFIHISLYIMASKRTNLRGKSALAVKKIKGKRRKGFNVAKNKIVLKDFLKELEESSSCNGDENFDTMIIEQDVNSSDNFSNWSEAEDFESDMSGYNNDTEHFVWLKRPEHNWIIDTKNLQECLQEVALCKLCRCQLVVLEDINFRDGLATKIHLKCTNTACISYSQGFFTSDKCGSYYEINCKSIQDEIRDAEGKLELENLCNVIGLAKPKTFIETSRTNKTESTNSLDFSLSGDGYSLSMESIMQETFHLDVVCCDNSVENQEGSSMEESEVSVDASCATIMDVEYEVNYCKGCSELNTVETNYGNKELSMMEFLAESLVSSDSELSMLEYLGTLKNSERKSYPPQKRTAVSNIIFYFVFVGNTLNLAQI